MSSSLFTKQITLVGENFLKFIIFLPYIFINLLVSATGFLLANTNKAHTAEQMRKEQ